MHTFKLKDKTILVTGARGFLGEHIVRALAAEGTTIYSTDLAPRDNNDPNYFPLDISNGRMVEELAYELEIGSITLDGVVNNAAVSYKGTNISSGDFTNTLTINIQGTDNCIKRLSHLFAEDASVVNVSSIYGMLSPDFRIYEGSEDLYNSSAYGASKAGVIQLTKYYATLLAPVRINAVSPGGIYQGHSDVFGEKYTDRVPLKRMAYPAEIVNAILFLLSPLSSYVNGHNLVVDGGLSAK